MNVRELQFVAAGLWLGWAAISPSLAQTAAPHRFSGIQITTNSAAVLSLAGSAGPLFTAYYDIYPLDVSSNLSNWTPLATLQQTNSSLEPLLFQDTNAPQFSRRFYRTPKKQCPTPDPQPTGPYAVGTFSMLLTNTNRDNARFMVTFWYPATAQAGLLPTTYVDQEVAEPPAGEEYAYYNFENTSDGDWDAQVAAFYSHSLPNAPIATVQSNYPVVLYDPGDGGHRRENTDRTEELASWGYVVAGLDTSDTSVSVFPDGTVVQGTAIGDFATATEGRLQDEQFVLDTLQELNASDPRIGGRLDLGRIGAFGWSHGGIIAAELCLRDPRCKAGAGFDGWFFDTNLLTRPLSVPFLFLRSDYGPDPTPWYISFLPGGLNFDCVEAFNAQSTNAYWVKLASTIHGSFVDYPLIVDSEAMERGWGLPTSAQFLPPARVAQILRTYLLSFYNKHLKEQDDHLLDGPSSGFPEVVQYLTKNGGAISPAFPTAALIEDGHDGYYGVAGYGGTSGEGAVFQVTAQGSLAVVASFSGTNGSCPLGGLIQGSDNSLYGTTEFGGTNGSNGTVFKVTAAGELTTLVSFDGANGSHPVGGLVQGGDGNFYGTTRLGGLSGNGTVFQVTPSGGLPTLHSFKGSDGGSPFGALVQGTDGDFYGTTAGNSANGFGSVFKITAGGLLTTLASFSGANGENPACRLLQGGDGNFYGTTTYGGNFSILGFDGTGGAGTVFKMTPTGTLTTLVRFNGANGYNPMGALLQAADGSFYGTTAGGGANGAGTVFNVTSNGVFTTVHSFSGPDGSRPYSGLALGAGGAFYGTTEFGGANGLGTVFQVTTNGALTTLVSF